MVAKQTLGGLDDLLGAGQNGGMPARVGKYRVDGIIGRGAVGVVYKGFDEQIGRPLAIKTLRADVLSNVDDRENLLKRFATEARSAGRCLHPNIVAVFDYVEQDGSPYIVMEFVDAGTLDNVIAAGTMLPIRQVGEIMAQLLLALDHAHGKGIVHRDVKPSNVLCPTATSIKVTDFGVARFEALGITEPSGIGAIGTPNYMSPEQFLGRPVDGRSDLFSAGVILFQLLAGAKPFIANDIAELMRKLLNETAPSLSTFRPGNWRQLDEVVQLALARNPADRFQSATEFIDRLSAAIEATGSDDGPPLDLTKISSSGRSGDGTGSKSRSGSLSQTMSAKLTQETISAVETSLARLIGPIARVVVRRAADEATDPDMMLSTIARRIPVDSEATLFRKEAVVTLRADRGVAAVQFETLITERDIAAASEALLPFIGPVAVMVARRNAELAIGHEDFYRRLGDKIPDEAQREEFLASMRRYMSGDRYGTS